MRDMDEVKDELTNGLFTCVRATAAALGIDLFHEVRGGSPLSPENLARVPQAVESLKYQLDKRDGRLGLIRQREVNDGSYAGLR